MSGVFLYYKNIDKNNASGIEKKVLGQVKAFNDNGLKCDIVVLDKMKEISILEKILARLPFGKYLPEWNYKQEFNDIDFLYFRRPFAFNYHMLRVLKKIKNKNPNAKIILEIPTFPYDKEMTMSIKNYPLYIKELYNRPKLQNVIDRIAVQNNIDKIFGIKTLKFENGLILENIETRTKNKNDNKINLFAVAMLASWHGYERILKGMGKYYNNNGKRNIIFHLVGSGKKEIERYKKIISKYNIEDHVLFYGELYGEKLKKIYNIVDIGLDVFGMYLKNNDISSSLKSREYLAKGLPFISGCKVDIIKDNFKYFKEFSNDSTPIDMMEIIDFYDSIYSNKNIDEVIKNIREYADEHCGMEQAMSNVINYIKE